MLAEAGAIEVVGKTDKMVVIGGKRREKHHCHFRWLPEALVLLSFLKKSCEVEVIGSIDQILFNHHIQLHNILF